MDLRGIDLNLLVSLRVLLTQRHVTRSAEKLGLTQPSMSASLARSRTLFRDKLLVRGPQGLVLTPRGEQILEQLNKIMEITERLIAVPGEFTPETSNRTFALMGNDFVEFVLLPSLMATLAGEAPNLQILFKSIDLRNIEATMANSDLDLAIGYLPKRFRAVSLLISSKSWPSWPTTRLWHSPRRTSQCIGTREARKTPDTSGSGGKSPCC
jgi:DNA-binding transcriptional LysR family regulator